MALGLKELKLIALATLPHLVRLVMVTDRLMAITFILAPTTLATLHHLVGLVIMATTDSMMAGTPLKTSMLADLLHFPS